MTFKSVVVRRPPGREGCLTSAVRLDPVAGDSRPLGPTFCSSFCSSTHNSDYICITPALVFVSLCQLGFTSVNWVCLSAITLAKSTIFFLVLVLVLPSRLPAPTRKTIDQGK